MAKEYVIDGSTITSLEAFYDQIGDRLVGDAFWGRNLDALDDVLRGGYYGIPEGGFILRWTGSEFSRANLGYPETVRQLELRLQRCHPESRRHVQRELDDARRGNGPTVFDWLVDIVRRYGHGGEEATANVRLILE